MSELKRCPYCGGEGFIYDDHFLDATKMVERTAKILNRSEGFYSAHGVCICGHCSQCGNEVCDDFRFCPRCGSKLDWSE